MHKNNRATNRTIIDLPCSVCGAGARFSPTGADTAVIRSCAGTACSGLGISLGSLSLTAQHVPGCSAMSLPAQLPGKPTWTELTWTVVTWTVVSWTVSGTVFAASAATTSTSAASAAAFSAAAFSASATLAAHSRSIFQAFCGTTFLRVFGSHDLSVLASNSLTAPAPGVGGE